MRLVTTQESPKILLDLMIQNGQLLPSQSDTLLRLHKYSNQSIEYLLLTLRLVSETTLQNYLQELYGISSIADPFMLPDEDAVNLFSPEEAVKLSVVPQKITGDSLFVLVKKPVSEGVMERINKLTGKYAVPCVVNPFRYSFLMHICYKTPMPPDEKKIALEILEGAGKQYKEFTYNFAEVYDPESGIEPKYPEDDPLALSTLPIADTNEYIGEISPFESIPLLDNDVTRFVETADDKEDITTRVSSGTHMSLASLSETFVPLDEKNIESYFEEVASKYDLPEIFYSFGARAMRSVALFTCSRNILLGWTGAGSGLHQIKLDGVMLPDDRGSFLADIVEKKYYLGPVQDHIVNKRLMNIMGGDTDDLVLGVTISVGKRPVIVVACILDDEVAGPKELEIMQRLCEYSEKTIIKLIKEQKKDNFK